MNIVLASASRQRKNILSTVLEDFEIVPADIDEKAITGETFEQKALAIASAKAEKVSTLVENSIIIAADSFIVLDGEILEKPQDKEEARAMLKKQSGKLVEEYTGCCILNQITSATDTLCIRPTGRFRYLSDREIEKYVQNNPVTEWAAAYSPAYDAGAALFCELSGSLTGFAYGLPIEYVVDTLKGYGVVI